MKTCLRLTLFACLLPMLTMAELVPYSCGEGSAFTIRIPVRIPAGASGEYEWYRNDTLIAGTRATLAAGVQVIAYTIPASKAYGSSEAYHFKYSVYEDGCNDCGEWISSPKYLITFLPCLPPQASEIMGSTVACAGQTGITCSVTSEQGVYYNWAVPNGWTITAGQGTSSVTVTATFSAGNGNISVAPSNSCGVGTTRTLAVAMNILPAPSAIEGQDVECANAPNITYSVANQQGVTYTWSVPLGWLITTGQYTHSITVRTGSANGTVSVTAATDCGSATRTKGVSTVTCPPTTCAGVSSPGAVGVGYCVPNPGVVGVSSCVPDPGVVGIGSCVPNPGVIGISYCVPSPGVVGIGLCVPDPGVVEVNSCVPDPGIVGIFGIDL